MARWRGAQIAAALLALLLPGCALPEEPVDSAGAHTTAGVTSAPATEEATTPATESSASVTTTRSRVDQPAVTVPQLPIGGDGQDGDYEQCVSVSYLGGDDNPLPERVRLTIEGASLTPPLLELGGAACPGDVTECLSAGFAFTSANVGTEAGTCFVAVQGTGERPGGDVGSLVFDDVELRMHGRARCPDGDEATCQGFAAALPSEPDPIGLEIAVVAATATSASESEATSSSGSTSESTEATATSEEGSAPTD